MLTLLYISIDCLTTKAIWLAIYLYRKNSKVFEQNGDLLNFKANIDSMAVLSQAEPS